MSFLTEKKENKEVKKPGRPQNEGKIFLTFPLYYHLP